MQGRTWTLTGLGFAEAALSGYCLSPSTLNRDHRRTRLAVQLRGIDDVAAVDTQPAIERPPYPDKVVLAALLMQRPFGLTNTPEDQHAAGQQDQTAQRQRDAACPGEA